VDGTVTALAACLLIALGDPATARDASARVVSIAIEQTRLTEALEELSRATDTDLLVSPEVTGTVMSRPLHGRMTVHQALSRLLIGTGFTSRSMPDGSILVVPQAVEQFAMPDILVVGRRTQDLDIARTMNDIQPYRVAGARDIASSHASSPDEYLRTRLPSNAQAIAAAQRLYSADVRSEVDLHGLGSDQTLVLIDGGRMPSIPTYLGELLQPDLNGLPIDAIDRIEVLPLTAGGIYGPGAIGGVVNVSMKRDHHGASVTLQHGPTFGGGGASGRLYGRIGFTPDDGRTEVELSVGASRQEGLLLSDRRFSRAQRERVFDTLPGLLLASVPAVNGVLIRSQSTNLTVKSPTGPIPLGSSFAVLPPGTAGAGPSTLRTSAMDAVSGPTDASGGEGSFTTATEARSLLVNVRHRFTDGIEAFVDLISLSNEGVAVIPVSPTVVNLEEGDPTNPFEQDVTVSFYRPDARRLASTRIKTSRLTVGAIVGLGGDWRGEGHVALGEASLRTRDEGPFGDDASIVEAIASGAISPLGSWSDFLAGLAGYRGRSVDDGAQTNRLVDISARVSGPLLRLPAGPAMLTVLAEQRSESAPSKDYSVATAEGTEVIGSSIGTHQRTRTVYGELRVPLLGPGSAPDAPARGELQLASRYDAVSSAKNSYDAVAATDTDDDATVHADQRSLVYTAGLRLSPVDHLMIRSSVATGAAPTPFRQIGSVTSVQVSPLGPDPVRAGRPIGSEGPVTTLIGGTSRVRPETSRSVSVGLVLNPSGGRLPRISIDLVRTRRSRQMDYGGGSAEAYILSDASRFADRILRAPLTDEDRAKGLKGGIIEIIDTTDIATAKTQTDAVDADMEYHADTELGTFRLAASGTWIPRFRTRLSPLTASTSRVGDLFGIVELRGNVELEWRRGRLSLYSNTQAIGSYSATSNRLTLRDNADAMEVFGRRVPTQFYSDLGGSLALGSRRVAGGPGTELRLSMQNVFNRVPPPVPGGSGYSGYGDPRLRRIDAVLSHRF
jgi:iron complex outermembrane receptor protein